MGNFDETLKKLGNCSKMAISEKIRVLNDAPEMMFEGATLGVPYKTVYGDKAIYLRSEEKTFTSKTLTIHYLVNVNGTEFTCFDNGQYTANNTSSFDIVGRWEEKIDRTSLTNIENVWYNNEYDPSKHGPVDCFEAGYLAAVNRK